MARTIKCRQKKVKDFLNADLCTFQAAIDAAVAANCDPCATECICTIEGFAAGENPQPLEIDGSGAFVLPTTGGAFFPVTDCNGNTVAGEFGSVIGDDEPTLFPFTSENGIFISEADIAGMDPSTGVIAITVIGANGTCTGGFGIAKTPIVAAAQVTGYSSGADSNVQGTATIPEGGSYAVSVICGGVTTVGDSGCVSGVSGDIVINETFTGTQLANGCQVIISVSDTADCSNVVANDTKTIPTPIENETVNGDGTVTWVVANATPDGIGHIVEKTFTISDSTATNADVVTVVSWDETGAQTGTLPDGVTASWSNGIINIDIDPVKLTIGYDAIANVVTVQSVFADGVMVGSVKVAKEDYVAITPKCYRLSRPNGDSVDTWINSQGGYPFDWNAENPAWASLVTYVGSVITDPILSFVAVASEVTTLETGFTVTTQGNDIVILNETNLPNNIMIFDSGCSGQLCPLSISFAWQEFTC